MHQRKLIKCSFYWGLLNRRKTLKQFVAAEISTWVDCENWFLNKSPRGLCRLREFQTKHEASFHYSVHCFDHRGLDVCSTSRRSWLRFVIHVKMVRYQLIRLKLSWIKTILLSLSGVSDERLLFKMSCSGKEAFHWNWRRAYSQVDRRQLAQHRKHLFVLFPKQQRVVLVLGVFGCRHQRHVCAYFLHKSGFICWLGSLVISTLCPGHKTQRQLISEPTNKCSSINYQYMHRRWVHHSCWLMFKRTIRQDTLRSGFSTAS